MAGTMSAGSRRGRGINQINVTPLVDVCLVLLIILMVSSTYIVSQTLQVQLPKAHTTDGPAEKPLTVTLLKNGTIRWDDKPVSLSFVTHEIQAAATKDPDTSLVVSADKEVHHGRVVHILDVAKTAGITHFAINVQAE